VAVKADCLAPPKDLKKNHKSQLYTTGKAVEWAKDKERRRIEIQVE